ncbi:MAG: hypothetical protein EZS28_004754 [Streblomastix strix]|uniref:Uncharacterized protein n=1 Tax=Streblomastix strix TaxID=222440 RepID=A0A5J4WYY7_9EUKA|nr:MAG: hypothetical protein EZS28_004754 [Streblomastix strix]
MDIIIKQRIARWKQKNFRSNKCVAERQIAGKSDNEKITEQINRGSGRKYDKMVQSCVCDTKERSRQMEENNRLFRVKHSIKRRTVQNREYLCTKRDTETVRLGNQDRYRKCISSCNCGQQPQQLSGFQVQEQDTQMQKNAICNKTYLIRIHKNNEISYEVPQRNFRNEKFCLQRQLDLSLTNQKATPIISYRDRDQTWIVGLKHLQRQSLLISTQKVEFLGWVINSSDDLIPMTIQRRTEMITILLKWRKISQLQQSKKIKYLSRMISKINFLRLQFKRMGLHIRILNQKKSKNSIDIRLEGLSVDGQKSITRNTLVVKLDQKQQSNKSFNISNRSYSENRYLRRRMEDLIGYIELENEEQKQWKVNKRKLATNLFESEGDCSYLLRDTQARILFKCWQNQQSKDRDRQRGGSLQHQERSSSNSICQVN